MFNHLPTVKVLLLTLFNLMFEKKKITNLFPRDK